MGELRKLRIGGAENDITPYTAGNGININGKQVSVNTNVIATKQSVDDVAGDVSDLQGDVTDLKEDFNQLPTEETGQEWLEEEERHTLYFDWFLGTLDRIFTELPQEESLEDIVDELVEGNSWLSQLYREVAASMTA